jgi:cell division protein FtsN
MHGASEGSEDMTTINETHEASAAVHKNSSGMRVMRASPLALICCGLIFLSLIFLLDFMSQKGVRAGQTALGPTPSNSQEKTQAAAAPSPQQPVSKTDAPVPQPKPAVETASIVPAVEAAPIARPAESPQPTPAPPAEKPPVKVEPPPSKAPAGEDGFTLQVGSYNELAQAQERVAKLESAGVSSYVARVEIPKRGTWYRVQTGRFGNREEAVRYGTQLKSKGVVADFIVAPSKAT